MKRAFSRMVPPPSHMMSCWNCDYQLQESESWVIEDEYEPYWLGPPDSTEWEHGWGYDLKIRSQLCPNCSEPVDSRFFGTFPYVAIERVQSAINGRAHATCPFCKGLLRWKSVIIPKDGGSPETGAGLALFWHCGGGDAFEDCEEGYEAWGGRHGWDSETNFVGKLGVDLIFSDGKTPKEVFSESDYDELIGWSPQWKKVSSLIEVYPEWEFLRVVVTREALRVDDQVYRMDEEFEGSLDWQDWGKHEVGRVSNRTCISYFADKGWSLTAKRERTGAGGIINLSSPLAEMFFERPVGGWN